MIGSIIPNRIAVLHNFIAAITFFYTKIVFMKTIMIVFVSLYTICLHLIFVYLKSREPAWIFGLRMRTRKGGGGRKVFFPPPPPSARACAIRSELVHELGHRI